MAVSLITGATGFLGYALARELLDAGDDVRALTRSGQLPGGLTEAGVTPVRGDLESQPALEDAMRGATRVFHAAADVGMWAPRWVQTYRTNVEGTRNVIEAALRAGVERLVYTSTGSTIGKPLGARGDRPVRVDEQSTYNFEPLSMTYPHTKWLGERLALAATARGLEVVVTHPTMVLGPGDWKHNLLPLFRAAQGRGFAMSPGGYRTTCDVRDVARGHRLAAELGGSGRRYILGGETRPMREVLAEIAASVGGHAPVGTLPDGLLVGVARVMSALAELRGQPPTLSVEMAIQSTFRVDVSSARAEAELGYRCRPLSHSLRDAVRWYRDEGLL